MKTYTILLFSLLSFNFSIGQAYVCPDDSTVTFLDLLISDQLETVEILESDYGYDYSSESFTTCSGDTMGFINYTYYIFKNAQPADTCYQRITILVFDKEDIEPILPLDTIIEEASYSDAHPDKLYFTQGSSGLGDLFGYQDSIVMDDGGPGATITRTWLIPIPCTSDKVITHVQQITINNYLVDDNISGIVNINAEDIKVDSIHVTVNDAELECGPATNIDDIKDCICNNADISADEVITLKIMKEGIDPDGVSTLDIVYTLRHILNIPPFLEPHTTIACDVNEDGKITALDILHMRRLILGIIAEFPGNKNWIFLKQDQSSMTGKNIIETTKSELCNDQLRILAIKKGDVNGTAAGL